jgi:UDP-N-acetylmuramate dehydrogenase
MHILNNISLKPYNTFGIAARAEHFCDINSLNDLEKALQLQEYPKKLVLSGGSNILITGDIQGLVLHINLKGIELVSADGEYAIVKVMAGENWHQLVLWTLDQDYGGLENLSLIPGNTGTAPIQNIGAYGVELKDVFLSCEAMDRERRTLKTFTKEQCQFGYRDSYFKDEGKDRYIITSVTFRLTKINHKLNTTYGNIEDELKKQGVHTPGIRDISNAVIAIRQSKLPDPKVLGNSGSFFKNPVITSKEFAIFMVDHPNAPFYRVSRDTYKIPAGWLIEQCGFKGKRYGDAGVHQNQALVLVNYGNATGKEILHLANRIIEEVRQKFDIQILPEVNIIK